MFIREQSKKFEQILKKDFTVKNYGEILEQSWEKKKNIGKLVTNTKLNSFYKKYRNYTYGGKICGAGSGGFFLFALSSKCKKILKNKIKKTNYIDFNLDHEGSKIIFVQ